MMMALELARFALYADFGVVFGVPAAAVLTQGKRGLATLHPLLVMAAIIGVPLSIALYLLTVAGMAGTSLRDLDWQLAGVLATGSELGWAFLVRTGALGAFAVIAMKAPHRTGWLIPLAAIALATLAWSSHAAASEGAVALARLGADILHLLAAALWIGALALFLAMLRNGTDAADDTATALARFGGIGSGVVAALGATGLANLWFLAQPDTWMELPASAYGQLLGAKLAIVILMLGLAGMNRFVLVPRLADASARQARSAAARALNISIAAEFALALAVLVVVSQLGLLDPASAS